MTDQDALFLAAFAEEFRKASLTMADFQAALVHLTSMTQETSLVQLQEELRRLAADPRTAR